MFSVKTNICCLSAGCLALLLAWSIKPIKFIVYNEIVINASPIKVWNFISEDPSTGNILHPLVNKVTILSKVKNEKTTTIHFETTEEIPYVFGVKVNSTFSVIRKQTNFMPFDGQSESAVFGHGRLGKNHTFGNILSVIEEPLFTLHTDKNVISVDIEPNNDQEEQCIVQDILSFDTYKIFRYFIYLRANQSHQKLLSSLKARMEK